MISSSPNFITPSKFFGGPLPKNFRGQKHAKFGAISDDSKLRGGISPERLKIFKLGQVLDRPQFLPRSAKKSGHFKVKSNLRKSIFGRPFFGRRGCCVVISSITSLTRESSYCGPSYNFFTIAGNKLAYNLMNKLL